MTTFIVASKVKAGDVLRFQGQDETVEKVDTHPKFRNIRHIHLVGLKSPLVETASSMLEMVV